MKNKNIKYIVISTIILIILTFLIILINNRKDKYSNIKKTISNTFFYLSLDEYDNMNNISDNCKISLLFDMESFKKDKIIQNTKGYSKSNILNSIKKVLGSNATINFSINDFNTYNFLSDDECIYNVNPTTLSYNSTEQVLYRNNTENNRIIMVNWNKVEANGSIINMNAEALMIVKNEKDYSLFIDKDMNYKIGDYKTLNEAKDAALKNYFRSYKYEFTFNYENGNYVWKKFKRSVTLSDMVIE